MFLLLAFLIASDLHRLLLQGSNQSCSCQSRYATVDPNCVCNLHHSSQHRILNLWSEARDQTCILMDTRSGSLPLSHNGHWFLFFWSNLKIFLILEGILSNYHTIIPVISYQYHIIPVIWLVCLISILSYYDELLTTLHNIYTHFSLHDGFVWLVFKKFLSVFWKVCTFFFPVLTFELVIYCSR